MAELAGRLAKKLGIGAIAVGILLTTGLQPTRAQDIALPDVQKLGPQTGAKVPDFTLADQHGQPRSLQSLMGPNGLMLVFSRSADWCPYCKTQFAELQTRSAGLKKAGVGVAAITYDLVTVLANFSERRGITPMLSDPGSATIKRTASSTRRFRNPTSSRTAFRSPARSC